MFKFHLLSSYAKEKNYTLFHELLLKCKSSYHLPSVRTCLLFSSPCSSYSTDDTGHKFVDSYKVVIPPSVISLTLLAVFELFIGWSILLFAQGKGSASFCFSQSWVIISSLMVANPWILSISLLLLQLWSYLSSRFFGVIFFDRSNFPFFALCQKTKKLSISSCQFQKVDAVTRFFFFFFLGKNINHTVKWY